MSEASPASTGPFVQCAVICERVLQEQDGVLSAIRIIDRLTQTVQAPQLPEELPRVQFQCAILVVLKSGSARGRHQVEFVNEHPSGRRNAVFSTSVLFEGEDRGNNLVVRASMEFDAEGLYWFDLLVDGRLMTRTPFRVIYQLVTTGMSP
jgi:hypothetical protein